MILEELLRKEFDISKNNENSGDGDPDLKAESTEQISDIDSQSPTTDSTSKSDSNTPGSSWEMSAMPNA